MIQLELFTMYMRDKWQEVDLKDSEDKLQVTVAQEGLGLATLKAVLPLCMPMNHSFT